VLGSIVMFAVIYALLFAVWVFVLNGKIQHGPEEAEAPPPAETSAEGLIEAVGTPRRELPHQIEAGR
jgi:cytochrome d ubiquinol oxidase subunit I